MKTHPLNPAQFVHSSADDEWDCTVQYALVDRTLLFDIESLKIGY